MSKASTVPRHSRAINVKNMTITTNVKPGQHVKIDPVFFVKCFGEQLRKGLIQHQKKQLKKEG